MSQSLDIIRTRATSFFENLLFDNPLSVILEAGYDPIYSSLVGRANLFGSITISQGTITIAGGGLVIQSTK